ncbi:ABC transporter fgm5 [Fusarium piperis]|uniref:ABC transporter fgm5 n=1 Tax=Fusarium piperis TaxID=1435070 RepID=A0A9W8W5I2_9HYPO|nr:ABC transporter fgm5 [Fusarium piperis]
MQVFSMFVAVMVVAVATQTKSNPSFAGASLVTLMSWCETISTVIRYYAQLETSIGAVARIKAFSETVPTEHLEGEDIQPPERWPEKGSIEIRGLSASYTTLIFPFCQGKESQYVAGLGGEFRSSFVSIR